ncbi:MAG: hypothetical protein HRF50_18195 [Phycisphaerae bacterium]|jgi:alpha/beta superfamily hydrolase
MHAAACEICEEHVSIPVEAAGLPGVLGYPFAGKPAVSAVIAGPHPLLGGNLRSNVVRSLRQALAGAGCVALTFDYRRPDPMKTGQRDWATITAEFWRHGCVEEERDWVDDLRSAARALANWGHTGARLLVGYSFGCWAVAQNAAELNPAAIVLVSPNPGRHDFSRLADTRAPLLVVQSDDDFTHGPDADAAWFNALREPKRRCAFSGGGHFFRGREAELTACVLDFLHDHCALGALPC